MRSLYYGTLIVLIAGPAYPQNSPFETRDLSKNIERQLKNLDLGRIGLSNASRLVEADKPDLGDYGHGYDSVTGTILPNTCVKITSVVPRGGSLPTPTDNNVFHEQQDLTQIRSENKVSGSASLLYKSFTASANGSIVNGNFKNSFSKSLNAYKEVFKDELVARGEGENGNPQLTEPARADLADLKRFKDSCGDYFVSGAKIGGILSVVASVKATVDKDWKQNEGSVSGGIKGVFSADFSKSASYAAFHSASSVDLYSLSSGAVPEKISIENIYEVYDTYKSLVDAKPGIATFIFTPYVALGGEDVKKIPDYSLENPHLDQLAVKRDKARLVANDLEVAMSAISAGFPSYFTIEGDVNQNKAEIDNYITSINEAVEICRSAIDPSVCIQALSTVGSVPANHVKRTMP